ncbi:B12-binding domain-containing radical SAM protein [Wukongibacter sp. M2B1]|uniref:B12-binding domain-containing radical SAM protein n=1 Tax=Wukongibacter sp. M2B1 TaxID=3088895 RepID=UPI003D7903B3
MRKIALIVPKGSKYGKNEYLKSFLERNNVVSSFYGAWETPNLSLLTIAGIIPDSYEISFIDEDHGMEIPFNEYFDIVALTGMTQQIYRAYEICEEFKKKGSYVVIGGIHATIMAEEALKYADTVFIGEGESTWKKFLKDFEEGTPCKKYICREYIDLSKSPVPRYEILDKNLYSSYSIQTTRGCPRTCNYCTLPIMYGSTYRHKSVKQIVEEIKAVQRFDPDPFIFFADDNMFIQKEHSKELVKEIEKLGIVWGTQTDISVAEDQELLELLYKSGCHWLFIGFENVSKDGLNFLDDKKWKATQLNNYERSIEKIHQSGIHIWGSFMFGGDSDTSSVFSDTLDFTLRNGIYSGSFTILTPLPGTQLFNQMSEAKRIIDYDWSRYTFWDVVFKPVNISSDELAKGVAWVYNQFYSKDNVSDRTAKLKNRLRQAKVKAEK